jgi:hypothetical protein
MGGGKSGGNAGTLYDYYGTLAGGVCIGPAEDLVAIILNGQQVWPQGTPWEIGLAITPGDLYVYDAQTWVCTSYHVATQANAPGSGQEGWTEYAFARTSETYDDFSLTTSDGTYFGVMRFYWGSMTQTVDNLLQSTGNDGGIPGNAGTGDQHPDYQGVTYVVIRDFLLGEQVQSGPNIEIVVRRQPNQTVITGAAAGITDGQANLAAVAVELLTDPNCLGLPISVIDETSFAAVADWLQTYQANSGASVLIDTSETVPSIFDKLTQMFDGYIRFNPTTLKIELGVYQHGVVPGSYTTLTADSLTKFPKFSVKSWQDTLSRATVRYSDRQINYQQTSVQVDDARAFAVLGMVREQALDRPWIARAAQAIVHGSEVLRVIGHAQMTGELEVRREIGRNIRAGDYVLVDVALEPNTNSIYQYFRVTQRKIPPTGPISLSVFADYSINGQIPYQAPLAPVLAAQSTVGPVLTCRYLEAPSVLTPNDKAGQVTILAKRPSGIVIGAQLFFDTDLAGTFSLLGNLTNFAAFATLSGAVAMGDAVLNVAVDTTQVDADYFTNQYSANDAANDTMLAILVSVVATGGGDPGVGQIAESGSPSAGNQIVEICSVSAQTLTGAGQYQLSVLRGRKNTSALVWTAAHTEVWLIPAALLSFFSHALFATLRANRGSETDPWEAQFRLCPFTIAQIFPLANATTFSFRFPTNSPG